MSECFWIAVFGWITAVTFLVFFIKALNHRDELWVEVKALRYLRAKYYNKLEASDE